MSIPDYVKFYIEKTKDMNTNFIFLRNFPDVEVPRSKKTWKPCNNCKKAIPTTYDYEPILGKAIKCRAWEKPTRKNTCSHYESKFYKQKKT